MLEMNVRMIFFWIKRYKYTTVEIMQLGEKIFSPKSPFHKTCVPTLPMLRLISLNLDNGAH